MTPFAALFIMGIEYRFVPSSPQEPSIFTSPERAARTGLSVLAVNQKEAGESSRMSRQTCRARQ
jgi:hypothetical protein